MGQNDLPESLRDPFRTPGGVLEDLHGGIRGSDGPPGTPEGTPEDPPKGSGGRFGPFLTPWGS